MPTITTVISTLWSVFFCQFDHAVYISVMEFNESELRIKVFTDDLQDAIRNDTDNYVAASNGSFCSSNKGNIESYFRKKVKLKINDSPIDFTYNKATLEGDSYWITFRLAPNGEWKKFEVSANYFMELFPTQINIVKIVGSKQRFCKINSVNRSCAFSF